MAVLKIRNTANTAWYNVGNGPQNTIMDSDGDTIIMCEESADEDKIRFDCGGVETLIAQTAAPQFTVQGATTGVIGLKAGTKENSSGIQLYDSDGKLFSWSAFGRDYGALASQLALYNWTTAGYTQIWNAGGEVTEPLQPSFEVYLSSHWTATATGYVTIAWDTIDEEVGSNFNTSTYTFTAPVTGKYLFTASLIFIINYINNPIQIITFGCSNRSYVHWTDMTAYTANWAYGGSSFAMICDMDASDTCSMKIYRSAGTAPQLYAGSSYSRWTGRLLG